IRIWRGLRTAFGRGRGGIGERGHAVMRSTGNCAGIPIFAKQIPEAQADRRLTVASGAREISVAGITLIADLAGALYWPEQRCLVVSDLHLEKGSSLASRGVLLPPYDTASTLERLADALSRHAVRTVVALGDSFHDQNGPARLAAADRAKL